MLLFLVFQPINSNQNIYMILSVSEQIKNLSLPLTQKHFYVSKSKGKKQIINDQSNSAASQSDDDNYDNKHNENDAEIESKNTDVSKQLLLE